MLLIRLLAVPLAHAQHISSEHSLHWNEACLTQVQLSLSQLHLICFALCAAEALTAAVNPLWTINLESAAHPEF